MKVVINDCLSISLAISISEGLTKDDIVSAEIGYRTPTARVGYWEATVSDVGAAEANVPSFVLNETGDWHVWTKIIVTGDQKYSGTASIIHVVNPWENL